MIDDELKQLIVRIDERTKAWDAKWETSEKRMDAHAGKIRALEMWRNWIMGAGALAGAIFSVTLKGNK